MLLETIDDATNIFDTRIRQLYQDGQSIDIDIESDSGL